MRMCLWVLYCSATRPTLQRGDSAALPCALHQPSMDQEEGQLRPTGFKKLFGLSSWPCSILPCFMPEPNLKKKKNTLPFVFSSFCSDKEVKARILTLSNTQKKHPHITALPAPIKCRITLTGVQLLAGENQTDKDSWKKTQRKKEKRVCDLRPWSDRRRGWGIESVPVWDLSGRLPVCLSEWHWDWAWGGKSCEVNPSCLWVARWGEAVLANMAQPDRQPDTLSTHTYGCQICFLLSHRKPCIDIHTQARSQQ